MASAGLRRGPRPPRRGTSHRRRVLRRWGARSREVVGTAAALPYCHGRSFRHFREEGWRKSITFLNGIACRRPAWRHNSQVRSHPRTMFFHGLEDTSKLTATPLGRRDPTARRSFWSNGRCDRAREFLGCRAPSAASGLPAAAGPAPRARRSSAHCPAHAPHRPPPAHPAPQRGLRQIELTRDHRDALAALLHHLDRFRLELRRASSDHGQCPTGCAPSHASMSELALTAPRVTNQVYHHSLTSHT